MIKLLVHIGIIILVIFGWIYGYLSEKRRYNKGICPKCGDSLIHSPYLDDSQGGIGFKCEGCGYCTWVTWFNPFKTRKHVRQRSDGSIQGSQLSNSICSVHSSDGPE